MVAITTAALVTDELTTDQAHRRLLWQCVALCALTSTIEVKDDFVVMGQSHQMCWVPDGAGGQQQLYTRTTLNKT